MKLTGTTYRSVCTAGAALMTMCVFALACPTLEVGAGERLALFVLAQGLGAMCAALVIEDIVGDRLRSWVARVGTKLRIPRAAAA